MNYLLWNEFFLHMMISVSYRYLVLLKFTRNKNKSTPFYSKIWMRIQLIFSGLNQMSYMWTV